MKNRRKMNAPALCLSDVVINATTITPKHSLLLPPRQVGNFRQERRRCLPPPSSLPHFPSPSSSRESEMFLFLLPPLFLPFSLLSPVHSTGRHVRAHHCMETGHNTHNNQSGRKFFLLPAREAFSPPLFFLHTHIFLPSLHIFLRDIVLLGKHSPSLLSL